MKEINVKAKKGIIRTSELHIPPTEHELATASYIDHLQNRRAYRNQEIGTESILT